METILAYNEKLESYLNIDLTYQETIYIIRNICFL